MNSRAGLAGAALALALCWSPVVAHAAPAAGADCAPEVERALAEGARIGVERDAAVLRHPDRGIRDPDSILDFSCLDDLFDYRRFDMLFDPGRGMADLLGLVQRRICAAAREAYRGWLGRPLDGALHAAPRLPGLDAVPTIGAAAREESAGPAPLERGVPLDGGVPLHQGVPLDQGVPLFRSIVGGGP